MSSLTNSILCMIVSGGKLLRPLAASTTTEAREDPSRLHAVGPNLGGYTQWVRWRAPTRKKLHPMQSSSIYTNNEEAPG
jgi:hypothetical protein